MDVFSNHLQSCMAQDLLQAEDIATIMDQIIRGERMPAEMGMQPRHPGFLSPPFKQQSDSIRFDLASF